MKKIVYISLIISLFILSCNKKNPAPRPNDKVVAKVYDNYLYLSEVTALIPDGLSPEDSAQYAENIINRWIEEQLLVNMAQEYLQDQQDEINRKVEAFRRSLIIHLFRDKLIREKLDTIVSMDEVIQYYEAHRNDFLLTQPAIQGFLVRIPLESPNLLQIKRMLYNLDPAQFAELKELINKSGGTIEDFRSQWRYFADVIMKIPYVVNNSEYLLKTRNFIQAQDDKYFYFLFITDYRLPNEPAPLELYADHIKKIILNKRSENLILELERALYKEAVKKGEVKIYY